MHGVVFSFGFIAVSIPNREAIKFQRDLAILVSAINRVSIPNRETIKFQPEKISDLKPIKTLSQSRSF